MLRENPRRHRWWRNEIQNRERRVRLAARVGRLLLAGALRDSPRLISSHGKFPATVADRGPAQRGRRCFVPTFDDVGFISNGFDAMN